MAVYNQAWISATAQTVPFAAGSYPLGAIDTPQMGVETPARQNKFLTAAVITFALIVGTIVLAPKSFSGKPGLKGISKDKPLKLTRALPAK